MSTLTGKTLFITGASRGIGLAIARRAAADGANIVVAAKTTDANPKLPGTIYSAAAEITQAGGKALALQVDIRDEASVLAAVAKAVETFGGIDILVNNASAISLTGTETTPMKRFDLMQGVNARGTYLCTMACLAELRKSAQMRRNPQVLTMSPPLSMRTHWFENHTAYSMAKYGMSMCTLGHAGEFLKYGIGVNSLWPRTAIATAALQMIPGVDLARCRKPEILADAAYLILTDHSRQTGHFYIDDELLASHGITDLEPYSVTPGTTDFIPDFFVD
ncbi:MAG TPA: NAD(P)-dependent oxidoreductase [Burkholderiaceae bacterium]|nr:NAD(P)-dependent oxidoreductase [Burkholderiaceae bacterium]HQZ07193.1 NAD(P)-dependent oxidoreductase [Burkholderiaceae bacterium]HRA62411.1 NAD(P)-dependent oxidoreductase [Burkholderiaceae bacterium]